VLFVHGINGTPANFAPLLERLDRTRFQPWFYYYPSGLHLARIADHLDQTMTKLELRYGFSRFAVVAHSMGGLVARGFIQRHAGGGRPASIPLFVTMATPWGGHRGAEIGVRTSPVVVEVWRDMAPGSEYQRSLYAAPLPAGLQHHLVFTFNDETVPLSSQLLGQAQRGAARLYGFGETHMGVLSNAEVSLLLNELLGQL
jgi:pimeloyl-ACP methyl ester carboxylesterase